jgi:hypothetical protein
VAPSLRFNTGVKNQLLIVPTVVVLPKLTKAKEASLCAPNPPVPVEAKFPFRQVLWPSGLLKLLITQPVLGTVVSKPSL